MSGFSEDNIVVAPTLQGSLTIFLDNNPHVHIHSFTSDEDLVDGMDAISEICCHSCGDSIYLVYDWKTMQKYPDGAPLAAKIKEAFVKEHKKCIEGMSQEELDYYKDICPVYRRKTKTVDLTDI